MNLARTASQVELEADLQRVHYDAIEGLRSRSGRTEAARLIDRRAHRELAARGREAKSAKRPGTPAVEKVMNSWLENASSPENSGESIECCRRFELRLA